MQTDSIFLPLKLYTIMNLTILFTDRKALKIMEIVMRFGRKIKKTSFDRLNHFLHYF